MDSRRSRSQADDYTLLSCKKFISEIRLILSNHYFECYFVNKKNRRKAKLLSDFKWFSTVRCNQINCLCNKWNKVKRLVFKSVWTLSVRVATSQPSRLSMSHNKNVWKRISPLLHLDSKELWVVLHNYEGKVTYTLTRRPTHTNCPTLIHTHAKVNKWAGLLS